MKYTDIAIIHSNDIHSYMTNFAKKKSLIDRIKEKNNKNNVRTFVFDSGDLFSGNIYFNLYRGTKEIELMNLLGCDAMTLGNHEFDYGDELLSRLHDFAQFPVISSNITYRDPSLSSELVALKSHLKYDLTNHSPLYVIGVTTLETIDVSSPTKNIQFTNPVTSIENEIRKVCSEEENSIIILLSHLGYDVDLEIAEKFPDIDVIIGGHTHTVLKKPSIQNNCVIVQAGQYGKFLGNLLLRIYEDKSIKILSYELIEVDLEQEEDPEVASILRAMTVERDQKYSEVIATIPERLNGERDIISSGKSNLARLITEAFYIAGIQAGFEVDAAILNGWGIRSSLEIGQVYFSDIVKVLPFSKRVVIVKIKGENLLNALQEGLYPQLFGITLKDHVFQIKRNHQYQDIQSDQFYTIVTNSFVWSGKDNYKGFENSELVMDLGLDVDVFSHFIRETFKDDDQ